jgi:hypothetical protein
MAEKKLIPVLSRSAYVQTLLVGGVIGALLGAGTAHLLWQARERRVRRTGQDSPLLTRNDAMQLGTWTVGLLRQIGELALHDR